MASAKIEVELTVDTSEAIAGLCAAGGHRPWRNGPRCACGERDYPQNAEGAREPRRSA